MKKIFSIRKKLILIFGLLMIAAVFIQGFLAILIAQKAVLERVEVSFKNKAEDTAEIIDGQISAFLNFIEGVARSSLLRNASSTFIEKVQALQKETAFSDRITVFYLTDTAGNAYFKDGQVLKLNDREWFQKAIAGTPFVTEPYVSRLDNELVSTLAVPIYDDDKKIIGVLAADTSGLQLSKDIDYITVGKTGYCTILGLTGNTIAHKKSEFVEKRINFQELAKTKPELASIAAFAEMVRQHDSFIGQYSYQDKHKIAASALIKSSVFIHLSASTYP